MAVFGLAFVSPKRELQSPNAILTKTWMFGYLGKANIWNVLFVLNASILKAGNWSFHGKRKSRPSN
jgi:hypothetical protein